VLGGFSRTSWMAVAAIVWLFVIFIAPDNLIAAIAKATTKLLAS
jgi:hypothetical protein